MFAFLLRMSNISLFSLQSHMGLSSASSGKSAEKQGNFEVTATNFLSKVPLKNTHTTTELRCMGHYDVRATRSNLLGSSKVQLLLIFFALAVTMFRENNKTNIV